MKILTSFFRFLLKGKFAFVDLVAGIGCLAYSAYLYSQNPEITLGLSLWALGGVIGLISAYYNPTRRMSEKIMINKIG